MKKLTLISFLLLLFGIKPLFSQESRKDYPKVCTEIKSIGADGQKLVALKNKKWGSPGSLTVVFLDGNDFLRSKVKQFAVEWSNYSGVRFSFVKSGPADIRVSFVPGRGSWSLIGNSSTKYSVDPNTGNVYSSNKGTTMNFGWFDERTDDEEFSRTVIHEFGHSIGLIHEHQSPAGGISWNKPEVYNYYFTTQGWTKPEVDENIFKKYAKSETQYSQYDKLSIMHYPIPEFLVTDPSQSVGWNTKLSVIDKLFIGRIYPIPQKPKTEPKDAHVGDIQGGIH